MSDHFHTKACGKIYSELNNSQRVSLRRHLFFLTWKWFPCIRDGQENGVRENGGKMVGKMNSLTFPDGRENVYSLTDGKMC